MGSIISFLLYLAFGVILVVGIGIAVQLNINKKKQREEADRDGPVNKLDDSD